MKALAVFMVAFLVSSSASASTWLYRIDGGEILSNSSNPSYNLGPDAQLYFDEAVDPPVAGGIDHSLPRIYDLSEVRNATGSEIAEFALAEARDDGKREGRQEKAHLTSRIGMRALRIEVNRRLNALESANGIATSTPAEFRQKVSERINTLAGL